MSNSFLYEDVAEDGYLLLVLLLHDGSSLILDPKEVPDVIQTLRQYAESGKTDGRYEDHEWISVGEAQQLAEVADRSVSGATIRAAATRGEFRAKKNGRVWSVHPESFRYWLLNGFMPERRNSMAKVRGNEA